MNSGFLKSVLFGCVLYLSFTYGDASLAKVTSIATAAVEQNLPASVYNRVFNRKEQSRRYKRDVITKSLADPQGCINMCQNNETQMIVNATMKNMAKLVGIAMQSVDLTGTQSPEQEAAMKKRVEDTTIANMGPLFQDLCTASTKADDCIANCPESQLRKIMKIWHDSSEALCEPSKNWNNFSDYWIAINCTNNTESAQPCDGKCGQKVDISNVTNLELEDDSDDDMDGDPNGDVYQNTKAINETGDYNFKYEADSKKNDATVGSACKTYTCEFDCYKPIMTQQCGAKAYDLWVRMAQSDARTPLHVLKEFGAVDAVKECKQFQ